MDLLHIIALVAIGTGAGFVQRVSGFGIGIFTMMFLPYLMTSHTAAATISTLFSCVTSSYYAICYRKDVKLRTALPMICAAFVAIPLGVYGSAVVSAEVFERLLGAVLIVLSLYFLFFHKRIQIKPTGRNGVLAGALGGGLNGLFSTGGPPVVLYLSNALTDNQEYFATIQFYFCFTNWHAMASRTVNGLLSAELLLYGAVGLVGCMMGDFFGKKVFRRLNGDRLKTIIYLGMILSGGIMLL